MSLASSFARKASWAWLALTLAAALSVSTPAGLAGAQTAEPAAIDVSPDEEVSPGTRIVPGEILVSFKPGTSEETRDQVLADVGGVFDRTEPLPEGGELVVARVAVGTEVTSADSIAVDPNVLDARVHILQSGPGEAEAP